MKELPVLFRHKPEGLQVKIVAGTIAAEGTVKAHCPEKGEQRLVTAALILQQQVLVIAKQRDNPRVLLFEFAKKFQHLGTLLAPVNIVP
jgi:hypothetical protein